MTGYSLCGWKVASAFPLPDLAAWTGDDRPADIVVRLDEVPKLCDPVNETPLMQIGADGVCRFEIAGVAAYRVDAAGQEITVAPAVEAGVPDIRVFLLGTVFAIVCFRRGLVPLHASCVRIGSKAVAFSGNSGAGKSTMAATFLKRGFTILADDVTVVDPGASGGALLWPAFPRLKLWRDVMDGFGLSLEGLERARAELEKFHLPIENAFSAEPSPLSTVYHLAEARDPRHEEFRPLTGIEAFLATKHAVYRHRLGRFILGEEGVFALASKTAAAVSSVRLTRLLSLTRADELVDEIVRREV